MRDDDATLAHPVHPSEHKDLTEPLTLDPTEPVETDSPARVQRRRLVQRFEQASVRARRQRANALIAGARQLERSGNRLAAEELLRLALMTDPEHPEGLTLAASLEIRIDPAVPDVAALLAKDSRSLDLPSSSTVAVPLAPPSNRTVFEEIAGREPVGEKGIGEKTVEEKAVEEKTVEEMTLAMRTAALVGLVSRVEDPAGARRAKRLTTLLTVLLLFALLALASAHLDIFSPPAEPLETRDVESSPFP